MRKKDAQYKSIERKDDSSNNTLAKFSSGRQPEGVEFRSL